MKTLLKIIAILAVFILFSCNDGGNGETWDRISLEGSQWKVLKITDKETSKETVFPQKEKNFEMIFRTAGKVKILNGCNFAYATYRRFDTSIRFDSIGPATKMYCQPISDFEALFVKVLSEVKTYKKTENQLILSSDKNDIVLEYVGKYDLTQGKVLFCTNIHILNCISEIEITVDGKKAGKIDTGSQYNDRDCSCTQSPPKIGKVFTMKEGTYSYTAKNVKCKAVNTTNEWSGTVKVKGDKCVTVFLDVSK